MRTFQRYWITIYYRRKPIYRLSKNLHGAECMIYGKI